MSSSLLKIFDGKLSVHYGQAYVFAGDIGEWDGDIAACLFNQENGLCGTATPRIIFLHTGLHTGEVWLSVEISDNQPTDTDNWEDVVEVPFYIDETAANEGVHLQDWDGECVCGIPLSPGSYRVRYCARNMDRGRDIDTIVDEDPVDCYRLSFWPAELAPDEIIKQYSSNAAYWHQTAKDWTAREQSAIWPEFLRPEFVSLSVEEIAAKVMESQPDCLFRVEDIVCSALTKVLEEPDLRVATRQFRQPLIEGQRVGKWYGRYIYSDKFYSFSSEALTNFPRIRKKWWSE